MIIHDGSNQLSQKCAIADWFISLKDGKKYKYLLDPKLNELVAIPKILGNRPFLWMTRQILLKKSNWFATASGSLRICSFCSASQTLRVQTLRALPLERKKWVWRCLEWSFSGIQAVNHRSSRCGSKICFWRFCKKPEALHHLWGTVPQHNQPFCVSQHHLRKNCWRESRSPKKNSACVRPDYLKTRFLSNMKFLLAILKAQINQPVN